MADDNADDTAGAWLTIEDAASALGVKKAAIRSRMARKTLRVKPGRSQNDGRTRVWVLHSDVKDETGTGANTDNGTDDGGDTIAGMMAALQSAHSAEIERLCSTHAEEIDRLQRSHEAEVERLAEANRGWLERLISSFRGQK